MILCGWCGHATDAETCRTCGRDPVVPWAQRGQKPPPVLSEAGHPALDEAEVRTRYGEAVANLKAAGRTPTVEAIAEQLDRSPRTVRDWRKRFGLR
jgi:hypothetical protein